jgi:sec-independent protein translocase protein TatA
MGILVFSLNSCKDTFHTAFIQKNTCTFAGRATGLDYHVNQYVRQDYMNDFLFLSGFKGSEILILALLILLLFGGKKIPELMRGLGKGIRNFKEGMKDVSDEINKEPESQATKKETTPSDKEDRKTDEPR